MRYIILALLCLSLTSCITFGGGGLKVTEHPKDTSKWDKVFADDLSNARSQKGIWTVSNGEMTASQDKMIFTKREYDNFVIDLELKFGPNANSGVVVYCSNVNGWIPNSVEVQILDDNGPKWKTVAENFKCGGFFGHLAPSNNPACKPGEWYRMTVTCLDKQIDVVLNGKHTASMDMSTYTSNKKNPDGSKVPPWLNKPVATLPTKGKIGLQGKHGGAPIWFRNIRIKELTEEK